MNLSVLEEILGMTVETELFFHFWKPSKDYLIVWIKFTQSEECIERLLISTDLEMRESEYFMSADMLRLEFGKATGIQKRFFVFMELISEFRKCLEKFRILRLFLKAFFKNIIRE
jgi:hypothetical protein